MGKDISRGGANRILGNAGARALEPRSSSTVRYPSLLGRMGNSQAGSESFGSIRHGARGPSSLQTGGRSGIFGGTQTCCHPLDCFAIIGRFLHPSESRIRQFLSRLIQNVPGGYRPD